MALDIPVQTLFELVGHDGSEIIFPAEVEPKNRRGVHHSEAIAIALDRGIACTPLQPSAKTPNPSDPSSSFLIPLPTTFDRALRHSYGVLCCQGRRTHHTVAFNQGTIFDPSGHTYPYGALHEVGLTPQYLWRLDAIAR